MVRTSAVNDLARLGPEDPAIAIPALTERLADDDPSVRASAATSLVLVLHGATRANVDRSGIQSAFESLLARIRDPIAKVRTSAADSLWQSASLLHNTSLEPDLLPILEALKSATTDDEPEIRAAVVRGLGSVGPKIIADADLPFSLLRSLEDDEESVRKAAVFSLTCFRVGLPKTPPVLVRASEKSRPEFRGGYMHVIEAIRRRSVTSIASLASRFNRATNSQTKA